MCYRLHHFSQDSDRLTVTVTVAVAVTVTYQYVHYDSKLGKPERMT